MNPDNFAWKPGDLRLKVEVGNKVLLRAIPAEGIPQELARVLEVAKNGTITVKVVGPLESGDDGLREVTPDQVERVIPALRLDKATRFIGRKG
jgi:hypothetical protein